MTRNSEYERYETAGVSIEITVGDISAQDDVDAVVNAANAELRTGGGVAGALHRAAGPGLAAEARPMAPISPGEAVLTSGHGLSNEHVIHCLGPVYGRDDPPDALLRSCYERALSLADEHGIVSVAFPAISTGAFGYPLEAATRIAVSAVLDRVPDLHAVRLVRFVLYDRPAFDVYAAVLDEETGRSP